MEIGTSFHIFALFSPVVVQNSYAENFAMISCLQQEYIFPDNSKLMGKQVS